MDTVLTQAICLKKLSPLLFFRQPTFFSPDCFPNSTFIMKAKKREEVLKCYFPIWRKNEMRMNGGFLLLEDIFKIRFGKCPLSYMWVSSFRKFLDEIVILFSPWNWIMVRLCNDAEKRSIQKNSVLEIKTSLGLHRYINIVILSFLCCLARQDRLKRSWKGFNSSLLFTVLNLFFSFGTL